MKKIGLIALALVTVSGVYAQKGVEDGSRYGHGEDSINTLKNISIYSEFIKTNNYKEAYESGWKEVFHDAPLASVNTYTYGIRILQNLYNEAKKEKNTELMTQYSNELFEVFEQRLKYLDQLNAMAKNKVTEADIYGQYGHAYRSYNPKVSVSKAYELLRKAVDLGKGETQYYVLDDLMAVSSTRYQNKKDNEEYRDALIQDYLDCAGYIDEFIASHQDDEKILQNATKVKENIDGYFVKSGAADCESLQAIYGPKIEANKDNLEYLTKVVRLMTIFECQSSDAYLTAAEYAHKISPSYTTAKALGKLRWPEISEWYINGYQKTVSKYYPQESSDLYSTPDEEMCLVIGLSFKQFDVLKANGIKTVSDLTAVMKNANWFKPLKGIGAKTSADIAIKVQRYLNRPSE